MCSSDLVPACRIAQLRRGARFRRWGRENALHAAIARCGRWRRPIDVPGTGRGAVGASRGRAGAESEKSRFSIQYTVTPRSSLLYATVRYYVLYGCVCVYAYSSNNHTVRIIWEIFTVHVPGNELRVFVHCVLAAF